ncbi:hypothetical protein G5C51_01405 [Streptomyces sp. A7024]|uniref:Uncharacterized protein n=1 Tax=Streptomyces coryli TaxID=1128680 RepID=A0A6G4TRZ8_9ACTN|nr:hypothetical protein [Streptomyces coryli]NGN62562.1 hypothetical protein [Streptomyces coryli]
MSLPEPSPADIDAAEAITSRHGCTAAAQTDGAAEVAAALGVLRWMDTGEDVPDTVVLAAHDLLYASAARHHDGGCMCRLAEVLVGRGVVPEPWDYEGRWWLWWPKSGRGPCRDCGKKRSLTRYSARFGKDYRYLCARCRAVEREQDAQQAAQSWTLLSESSQAIDHGDHDRLPSPAGTAAPTGPLEAAPANRPNSPTDGEWGGYVERLHELLAPLEWAGFKLPEEWDSDFDPRVGALLFSELWRGNGCLVAEYWPHEAALELQPFDDVTGDWPDSFSLLDDAIKLAVRAPGQEAVTAVARAAGEAGLLDATHVRVADSAPEEAKQEFAFGRIRRIFEPAADFRQLPLTELLREVSDSEWLSAYLDWVVGIAGRDVAPDIVPDAAALGVAAWCWRNNTAVEEHHLATDVLMARVNIAVTRITQEHVCLAEGINWDAIRSALTDPQWSLPDGTPIHSLFGPGWSEVASTVTDELTRWQQIEYEVLGPVTTLILMTIGGSTSYTDSWWGQGRWRSICRRVIEDATAGGAALPKPYDDRGSAALLTDLENPDRLPNQVLDWLIDIPETDADGPRGLRMHPATRPQLRYWDPFWLNEHHP